MTQSRALSSTATGSASEDLDAIPTHNDEASLYHRAAHRPLPTKSLNAPSYHRASRSAKLAALHARLSLPAKMPLEALARCLVDETVDRRPGYNNKPFALLGQDLLGYHTAEYLMCRYPRLPMAVLYAAQYAYVGQGALATLRAEWGVEVVAAPGPEVDPGLLQFKRQTPGNSLVPGETVLLKDKLSAGRAGSGQPDGPSTYRRGLSGRIVYDDQFGEFGNRSPSTSLARFGGGPETASEHEEFIDNDGITVDAASADFVRALTGALHTFGGDAAAKAFHRSHILSRHLKIDSLMNFTRPTRDLSRLCAREGFEPPVARLISETGRLSRTPVFIVGVYSGNARLGEGAGSSLNEARVRAAAAALRSWYLYSPPESEIVYPSDVEGEAGKKKKWRPQMIDVGEVIA